MVRAAPRLPRLRCSSRMLLAGIKEYLQESSLHGLRYLADPGRHWSERLFWAAVCVASLIGTYFLLMSSWNAFQYHAVSFVSETAYLDWNTTFPAVSVCETESPDKLYESATKVFGVTRNRNLDFFLRDIVFFDGTCRSCSTQCGPVMNCTDDFLSIIERVRSNCTSLINNCRWNGELFDCCKNFLPLQTETGLCYTINSLHNRYFPNGSRVNNQLVDLISNRRTGPGTLDFMAKESIKGALGGPPISHICLAGRPTHRVAGAITGESESETFIVGDTATASLTLSVTGSDAGNFYQIFIHAPEDVPNFNHPQDEKESLFWGLNFHMRFAVTEIENDPQLLDVSVAQRNCRFPHESPLTLHDKYSYSTCIVECHARYQMQFCNCTHHYMPNMHNLTTKTCGVEGLACLNLHSETLRSLKTSWSTKPGLACDCVSSCTEPEYSVVWKSSQGNDAEGDAEHDQGTKVRLMLDSLPTTRFRRNVVRTRLDLVVSMGGTAGLFLGASLLTLVELVYYACRTPSFKLLESQQGRQSSSQSKKSTPPPPPSLPGPPSGGNNPTGPSAAGAWRRLRHDYGGSPMVRRVQPALPAGPVATLEDGAGYYKLASGNAKVERSAYKKNLRQYSDAFDLYM